ncbi:MAG TPA: circularly permuted type 2 ATP-grasp protein, partial [Methylocystis sp.]
MSGTTGATRPPYEKLAQWLAKTPLDFLSSRRAQAELLFRRIGITFAVYGTQESTERLIPFDILPRIIARAEWIQLEKGLIQRVRALNLFLADLYGAGEIMKAGVVPSELIYRNPGYRPEMAGWRVPHNVYVQIAGIDIVRT